jgi:hypothetical protein
MLRQLALLATVTASVILPAAHPAAAEDAATVQDVSMMVDAKLNGKDTWSPGGRELHWAVSKCPFRIQFRGEVTVDKPTKITYRWERSDGTSLPTQTFEVKKAGEPVDVIPPDVWTVGASGQLFRGAEIFHVMTPSDQSTTTPIRVECE